MVVFHCVDELATEVLSKKAVPTVVRSHHMHTRLRHQVVHPAVLPARCSRGVLVKKLAAIAELTPIPTYDEAQMCSSFVRHGLNFQTGHILVAWVLPCTERIARRRPTESSLSTIAHELNGLCSLTGPDEAPGGTVELVGANVECLKPLTVHLFLGPWMHRQGRLFHRYR